MVTHFLYESNINQSVNICAATLPVRLAHRYQPFLSWIVTGDEKWVFMSISRTEKNGLALTEKQFPKRKLVPIRVI